MADEKQLDNREAIALIQRQVCGAEIAVRALHDNDTHGIRSGDLLMFNRRPDAFRCTGLIRGWKPEDGEAVSMAYAAAMAELYPPVPTPRDLTA
jgi:hypothetical protein